MMQTITAENLQAARALGTAHLDDDFLTIDLGDDKRAVIVAGWREFMVTRYHDWFTATRYQDKFFTDFNKAIKFLRGWN